MWIKYKYLKRTKSIIESTDARIIEFKSDNSNEIRVLLDPDQTS
jgi:hypothetical protein